MEREREREREGNVKLEKNSQISNEFDSAEKLAFSLSERAHSSPLSSTQCSIVVNIMLHLHC